MIGFNWKKGELKNLYRLYSAIAFDNALIMRCNDKIFIDVEYAGGEKLSGTLIIPRDGSYTRFIRDSWYDGVDVENL